MRRKLLVSTFLAAYLLLPYLVSLVFADEAARQSLVQLPDGWHWDRPVASHAELIDGGIRLRTETGRIWNGDGNQNRIVRDRPLGEDDAIRADLELMNPAGKWEQCGLFVFENDDAFVKAIIEHIDGECFVVVASEFGKARKVHTKVAIAGKRAQLKLRVESKTVTAYWQAKSSDHWSSSEEIKLKGDGSHYFGIFTQDAASQHPTYALVRDFE